MSSALELLKICRSICRNCVFYEILITVRNQTLFSLNTSINLIWHPPGASVHMCPNICTYPNITNLKIRTLRELPALIFRNWVHFKQLYV